MRAVLCTEWGGPEKLVVDRVAAPEVGPDGVLISVRAAGVNFADTLAIAGKYQEKRPLPFIPGMEVAGVVVVVGEGVTRVRPGDRVMALTHPGGYAERAVARESEVFRLPAAMDFPEAAGFPITYGTAYGGLVWRAGLRPGETLLVHGAAGGVGLAAVEVGKTQGATVIATAGGPDKLEVARAHGADHGIDTRREDLRARVKEITAERGADVVFDPVGGDVFDASLRCVAWGARLVVIGFAAGRIPQIPANVLLVKNISVHGLYWGSYRTQAPELFTAQFAALFGWFEAGHLKPLVSHRLDLARAAEALGLLISRALTGKVVLTTGAQ